MTNRAKGIAAVTAATLLIGAGAGAAYQGSGRVARAGAAAGDATTWSARAGQGPHGGSAGPGSRGRIGNRDGRRANVAALTATERATLVRMRQEEKLARDVYLQLAQDSSLPALTRIAAAEQRHMDRIGALLERYGLPDPVAGMARGEYADPAFEVLYRDLVARGSTGDSAAVAVGLRIERLDIADLDEALSTAVRPDVVRVLTALRAGSMHHLAAFTALS